MVIFSWPQVLDAFDAMVNCIFESARLQVECNVVSLRIAIVGGDVKYRSFKATEKRSS